jgi:hypothetical protein
MAAYGNSPFAQMAMAQALRQRPQQMQLPQGGGTVGGGAMGGFGADSGTGNQVQQQGQQSSNPISPQTANNLMKYAASLKGGGATGAAGQAAMPAMSAGGGSSLGTMGLQQGAVSFPGAASVGGGSGGASSAMGGGLSGGLGAAGGVAGLAALAFLGDKEMNESKNSPISTDKLNSLSYKGIGLRGGDLINGFNPATWASDPKKAAKGLANAFTFGLADKIF